jgi:hypothetical protein
MPIGPIAIDKLKLNSRGAVCIFNRAGALHRQSLRRAFAHAMPAQW